MLTACSTLPRDDVDDAGGVTGASGSAAAYAVSPHPPSSSVDARAAGAADRISVDVTPPADLWDRIRTGFSMAELDSPLVSDYERWYASHPAYVERTVGRASRYLYFIVEQLERRNMPLELALLPAVESAFRPEAYSRAHAAGLWQFIPATGRRYGLKQNWWYEGRRDITESTRAALDYLEFLHDEFDGDWFLALAAYNAGEATVARAMRRNRAAGRPARYADLALRSETRRYVPKLLALRNVVSDPASFGLTLAPIPNEPYFAEVEVREQIDLGVAAQLASVDPDTMRQLNPAFRRWATDPAGPHRLLVPADKAARLEDGLKALPHSRRMRWDRYVVRRGDTLGGIARHRGVTVDAIRRANRIRGDLIRVGQNLLIPVVGRPMSTSVASAAANGHGKVVHHVQPGDTLWKLSRRYNVVVQQLATWNSISVEDVLRLGQELVVYVP